MIKPQPLNPKPPNSKQLGLSFGIEGFKALEALAGLGFRVQRWGEGLRVAVWGVGSIVEGL